MFELINIIINKCFEYANYCCFISCEVSNNQVNVNTNQKEILHLPKLIPYNEYLYCICQTTTSTIAGLDYDEIKSIVGRVGEKKLQTETVSSKINWNFNYLPPKGGNIYNMIKTSFAIDSIYYISNYSFPMKNLLISKRNSDHLFNSTCDIPILPEQRYTNLEDTLYNVTRRRIREGRYSIEDLNFEAARNNYLKEKYGKNVESAHVKILNLFKLPRDRLQIYRNPSLEKIEPIPPLDEEEKKYVREVLLPGAMIISICTQISILIYLILIYRYGGYS